MGHGTRNGPRCKRSNAGAQANKGGRQGAFRGQCVQGGGAVFETTQCAQQRHRAGRHQRLMQPPT
jgi:hypothetical protein